MGTVSGSVYFPVSSSAVFTARIARVIRSIDAAVLKCTLPVALLILLAVGVRAQNPGVVPAFTTLEPHEYDTINLATLAIHLNVPVRSKAGHISLSYQLVGDIMTTKYSGGDLTYFEIVPGLYGQETHLGVVGMSYGYQSPLVHCGNGQHSSRSQWSYTDQNNSTHPLSNSVLLWDSSTCGATSYSGYTIDGSGIYVSFSYNMTGYAVDGNGNTVNIGSSSNKGFTDSNGNSIFGAQSASPPYSFAITDTLAQSAVTFTNTTNPETITWTDAAGSNQSLNYYTQALTLYSWFGCDWNNPGTSSWSFPLKVVFPDESTLGYTWEKVYNNSSEYTGRLASITIPTGATISYTYSGGTNGINCADGTTATLTRTTPDGQWKYSHVPANGTIYPGPGTTTVTDAKGNNAVYTFSGLVYPNGGGSDLIPVFRTSPSMISDEGKGNKHVGEQAYRSADHRGAETTRSGA